LNELPSISNIKETTPRLITIKLPNTSNKEKILKAVRKKKRQDQVVCIGAKIKMTSDFLLKKANVQAP